MLVLHQSKYANFYMQNEQKRKQIFFSKHIFYLFCLKAKILKLSEANIFKKNRILIEAWDLWKAFLYNFKQYSLVYKIFASKYLLVCKYLQANIRLNVKFAWNFVNICVKMNIFLSKYLSVWENVEAHIRTVTKISFNMY